MKNFYEMLRILERMEPTCYKCDGKLKFFKETEHYEEWKCEDCGSKVYMDIGAKAEYDKYFTKKESNDIRSFEVILKGQDGTVYDSVEIEVGPNDQYLNLVVSNQPNHTSENIRIPQ